MRSAAAARCKQLLAEARKALLIDPMGPPADAEAMRVQHLARRVRSIGVTSAYRTNGEEQHIGTQTCFPKYYRETRNRRSAAAGGPHGDGAVRISATHSCPKASAG